MAERVGAYTLIEILGRGGFGEVWKARDESLGRDVALKLLTLDAPEDQKRFLREAQTAASLSHPNIAAVYDAGEAGGRHYIAMQLVDGASPKGPLPPRDAARIVRDAARAVAHAHDRGIVHRDIKPGNIMVGERVHVMDFGLARSVRAASSLTASGMLVGTPAYMSPEQARGEKCTPATDVHALGATLYELVDGGPPFPQKSVVELLERIVTEEAPVPRRAPPDLAAIIARCLSKRPGDRYATAAALADDLDRFLEGRPVGARRRGLVAQLGRRLARRKGIVTGAMLATVTVGVVLAILLGRVRATEGTLSRRAEVQRLYDVIRETRPYFYIADADMVQRLRAVDRALAELERLEPKDAETWIALGTGYELVGDDAKAEAALLQAEAMVEDDGRVNFTLGRIFIRRALIRRLVEDSGSLPRSGVAEQLTRRALDRIRRPSRTWPEARPIDVHVAGAYLALAEDRRDDVLRLCEEGEERFGSRALGAEEYWILRGCWGEGSARIAAYTSALERRPHDSWALFMRGTWLALAGRFEEAAADLDRAVALGARFAVAYLNRGCARYGQSRLEEALADFSEAIRQDPSIASAWSNRGEMRRLRGDRDGALADLNEALQRLPSLTSALLNRAFVHQDAGRASEALADCEAGLRAATEPRERANLEALRAELLLGGGDPEGAAAACAAALQWNPGCAPAHRFLAELRLSRGELGPALDSASEAVRLDPGFPNAWVTQGRVRLLRGDARGAIEDFTRAIKLRPSVSNAWNGRGAARRQAGETEEAIADFTEAIRIDPLFAAAWLNRGEARSARDAAGAMADFSEAIRLAPTMWEAWLRRAMLRQDLGDGDGALGDYEACLRAKPDCAAAWNNRGNLRLARGEHEAAVRDTSEAIRLAPGEPKSWYVRGLARIGAGDLQAAIADLSEAIRLKPGYADAHVERGLAHLVMDDARGAVRDCDEAIRLGTRDGRAWFNRGSARDRLGDAAGAIADYEEAIRVDPGLPEPYVARGMRRVAAGDVREGITDFELALKLAPARWQNRTVTERLLAEARAKLK